MGGGGERRLYSRHVLRRHSHETNHSMTHVHPRTIPDAPAEPDPSEADDEVAPPQRRQRSPLLREIAKLVLIVVIVFGGTRLFLLPYQVDGASMTPYLANGEHLFVNRTAYAHVDVNSILNLLPGKDHADGNDIYPFGQPHRGDVIVLTPPVESSDPYVKRIIGLPGETVTFHEGLVFIDGQPLTESYITGAITECRRHQWCAVRVPEDSVFVLGDNRTNSSDSRMFGPVRESAIIGRAIFSNWPLEKLGPIQHPDYDRLPV